jgi:filamin
MHEILIEIGDDRLGGHFFRVMPRLVTVKPPGMAPCALGSLVEVLVNATGAPRSEDILVTAYSPSGRSLKCPLKKVDEGHSAIFKPDEAGIWEIAITYQGNHIQGSPYTCSVFDPSGVSVHGLDGALPFKAHAFEIDARGVGVSGELHVDIVCEKRSVVCAVEKLLENKFRVTFMPRQNGKHRVYIYFNGYDNVRGSPFIMRVGTKGRSGKTRSSPSHENSRYRSESPSMHFNSSMLKNENVKRELYSPPHGRKSESYSPQLSPSYHTEDRYDIKTSKEIYLSPRLTSPTRVGSPGRDLYSPKLVDEQQQHGYSTIYKSDFKKEIRKSQSPTLDSVNQDSGDNYSKKSVSKTNFSKDEGLYSQSYYTKLRNDSDFVKKSELSTLISSPINVSFQRILF